MTVGGGTGSFTLLSGLKVLPDIALTALVSMADDGGSTGVLRDELGVLPPGDVRQCLVALSEETQTVRSLMNYRFEEGALRGHSFGNLFLAALEKVTGDFALGAEVASSILKVKGKVLPVTSNKATLCIELSDGDVLIGENSINHADLGERKVKKMFYEDGVDLSSRARHALLNADMIVIGPGNYYCSLLPNLIVNGFQKTILETNATLVYVCNLTNKQGHTLGWKASDYVEGLEKEMGRSFDAILVNTKEPSKEQVERYRLKEGDGVLIENDLVGERVTRGDFLSETLHLEKSVDVVASQRSFIRHDGLKIARAIEKLFQ